MQQLASILSMLVKAVAVLGLLAVSFGPAYSHAFIKLAYASKWSNSAAPQVLSAYMVYVLLVAVNGITEAFVHATQSRQDLRRSNFLLVGFTTAHIALSFGLVARFGTVGLVLADAANMLLRISYSLRQIAVFFRGVRGFSVLGVLPRVATVVSCAAASLLVHASEACIYNGSILGGFGPRAAAHVSVGASCLAVLLVRIYSTERAAVSAVAALRTSMRLKRD